MNTWQTTTSHLRRLQIAPRKVALVLNQIRGQKVRQALDILQFSIQRSARPMRKLLSSAVANAVYNHGLNNESLWIKTLYVTPGRTLKRIQARAQGRAFPIRKRSSHITLILAGQELASDKNLTAKAPKTVLTPKNLTTKIQQPVKIKTKTSPKTVTTNSQSVKKSVTKLTQQKK